MILFSGRQDTAQIVLFTLKKNEFLKMEDRVVALEKAVIEQAQLLVSAQRHEKVLAENLYDLKRQMEVEVEYLQKQLEQLDLTKKNKNKKKAGKKEKKEDSSKWMCGHCEGPYGKCKCAK